jgi:hypothetical protein
MNSFNISRNSLGNSVTELMHDANTVRIDLINFRSELNFFEDLLQDEGTFKPSKNSELLKIIESLQQEIKELNLVVDITCKKVAKKCKENKALKEDILRLKTLYSSDTGNSCKCFIH